MQAVQNPDPADAARAALPCVIVTRPQPQADIFVQRLRALNLRAVALPLLRIGPPADAAAVATAWQTLGERALVMFVSPTAVDSFFAAAAPQAPQTPWPPGTLAAATGPGSAAALLAHGVPAERIVHPADDAERFDSESLWTVLQKRRLWAGASVLIVRGEGGRGWLAERLRQHEAQVDFVEAYRRLPPAPDAVGRELLAAALATPSAYCWHFSSSEAVAHLGALQPAGDWSASHALATHPRIAEAAQRLGFVDVREVAPTAEALRDALHTWPGTASQAPAEAENRADRIDRTVNDVAAPAAETPPPAPGAAPVVAPPAPPTAASGTVWMVIAGIVAALSVVALTLALLAQQRVKTLEQELVRRQQDSQGLSSEARALARQAAESAQSVESKIALLEGKVAETALQRTQLEELIQQLSRSRDDNVLADVDATLRVGMQQAAITGSAEPLAAALRQAEERLARLNQPRLERVRRAIARDLERVQATALTDIAALSQKLDEMIRGIDDLPLLAQVEHRLQHEPAPAAAASGTAARVQARAAAAAAAKASAAASADASPIERAWLRGGELWNLAIARIWSEARSLVRVTQINNPDAALIAPEQEWFLRANLKLRLLDARLALLSRQFDTAQADLRDARVVLERYFDRGSRRVTQAIDQMQQMSGQIRKITLPRPDESLAALAAAQAGR